MNLVHNEARGGGKARAANFRHIFLAATLQAMRTTTQKTYTEQRQQQY